MFDKRTHKGEKGREYIPIETNCMYLGVKFENSLQWKSHIENLVKKAYRSLHNLMRILRGCNRQTKEKWYLCLVRPHLEYAASVWDLYQDYLVKEIDGVQRKAARFVLGDFRTKSSVTAMIKTLGWETLQERRDRARIVGMYRSYTTWGGIHERLHLTGNYISKGDHPYKIRRDNYRTNWGKYSFIGRGVKLWNSLPGKVLDPFPRNAKTFKTKLISLFVSKP